jgi:predicted dehydrogenase
MTPNLALIGCGAIARNFYLPALAKLRTKFGNIWLVDPSDHALSTAKSIVPARTASRLTDVSDEIHLVIVATPNHLHFPLALEALSRHTDVLIEKPFVIWPDEGHQIVKVAAEGNRVIAVNQTRRFFPVAAALRERIKEGNFGALRSIVHREGTRLLWPFESGVGFKRGARRTGVVMDFGVHVLDFYDYLFQPRWEFVSATHDGFCGPEGLAEIALRADGAPLSIRLSRYHEQENVAHLFFERAEVSFDVYDSVTYSVHWNTGESVTIATKDKGNNGYGGLAEQVLLNFLAASERREQAICDGASTLPVIELLDQIYHQAGLFPESLGAA